jgi:hypothetical protein
MTQKSLTEKQISPIKNPNFEKPSRNLSNRTKVKILTKKIFLDISQKKVGSAYAQSPRKCSNLEILAKIEGKEANFFSKIYERHIRIWFRSKKNSKWSHACVPLINPLYIIWMEWNYFSATTNYFLSFTDNLTLSTFILGASPNLSVYLYFLSFTNIPTFFTFTLRALSRTILYLLPLPLSFTSNLTFLPLLSELRQDFTFLPVFSGLHI